MQIENWRDLEPHPLANLVPRMTPIQQSALNKDIKDKGLRFPIVVVSDGNGGYQILDGRNRHEACVVEKVDPEFWEYPGDDLSGFVVSTLQRKDLTWAEKTGAIKNLLAQQPDLSSRSVAKEFRVSHHTVEKLRHEMPEQQADGRGIDFAVEEDSGVSDAAPSAAKPVQRRTKTGKMAPGVRAGTKRTKRNNPDTSPKGEPQAFRNDFIGVRAALIRDLDGSLEVLTMIIRDEATRILALSESRRRSFMDRCIAAFGLRPTEQI